MFTQNKIHRSVYYLATLLLSACGSSSNIIDGGSVDHLPQGAYYAEISDIASNISNQFRTCEQLFAYPQIINVNSQGQLCINNECGITITLTENDYDQCGAESSMTDMGELNETINFCQYADTVFSGVVQKEYPSKKLVCSAILIMYPAQ